jgi:predicted GNAT family N-acyltransferase
MAEGKADVRPIINRDELREALRVRVAVFVDEQGGPAEDEPDAWDAAARHFVIRVQGRVVGTARLYHPETGTAKIGRVAVLPEHRRRGFGAMLVAELLRHAAALGCRRVVLDAQASACAFYERFGFQPVGEVFMEAGIPHQRMVLDS